MPTVRLLEQFHFHLAQGQEDFEIESAYERIRIVNHPGRAEQILQDESWQRTSLLTMALGQGPHFAPLPGAQDAARILTATTITELLDWHGEHQPQAPALVVLDEHGLTSECWSYAELRQRARTPSGHLTEYEHCRWRWCWGRSPILRWPFWPACMPGPYLPPWRCLAAATRLA